MARHWFDKQAVRLRRWTRGTDGQLTRAQRTVGWWLDLVRHVTEQLRSDRAGQMAAALTYHTMFSLLPTIVLMLVVLNAFVGEEKREEYKTMAVEWLTKPIAPDQQVRVDDDGPPADQELTAEQQEQLDQAAIEARERRRAFDEARAGVEQQVMGVLNTLEKVNFGGISIIGLLVFIYGATGLLTTIEKSFNLVYDAPKMRPPFLRFPLYFTVIVLGPVVVLAGQAGQEMIRNAIETGAWTGWAAGPLVFVTPMLTIGTVATLVFRFMPNTKVAWHAAIIGAFASTVLWFAAIEGLKIFVVHTATSSIYGALFLLPLFLLWLWISWVIILFGLELAYTIQHIRRLRFQRRELDQQVVIDIAWLLPLVASIAQAFEDGRTTSVGKLAGELNLPVRAVSRMLHELERADLVRQVESDNETLAYTLARPAERISAAAVLDVGERLMPTVGGGTSEDPAWKLIRRMRNESRQAAADTTLAQLARNGSADSTG